MKPRERWLGKWAWIQDLIGFGIDLYFIHTDHIEGSNWQYFWFVLALHSVYSLYCSASVFLDLQFPEQASQ